jgi:tetratricopeptide (TPR) repeat protein
VCGQDQRTPAAQKPANVTRGEMALLPEYCIDTQGFSYGDQYFNTSPRAAHWVALMGPSFWHHHHYCWALVKLQRAKAPGIAPQARAHLLAGAGSDFDYVIRNAQPNFVMLPEVLLRFGDLKLETGEIAEAQELYAAATRRKPDYWPAYANWALFLERSGRRKDALDHLALGLRNNRNAAPLQGHYKRLGGNLDALLLDIDAAARASNAAASTPEPASAAASAPAS